MTNRPDILDEFGLGKMPPQSVDIEEAVLGALLIDHKAIDHVIDILKPESFYKEENNKIYSAILDLNKRSKNIDILTVNNQLQTSGHLDECGGFAYLSQLSSSVSSAYNIKDHAYIVQQKYVQREFIRVSYAIQNMAFDDSTDIRDLIEFSENSILSISDMTSVEVSHIKTIVPDRIKLYEDISKGEKKFSGVPSGFRPLDKITLGWQPSDLIVMAARPSIGKTQMMLHFTFNAAIQGYKILVFTLEMSKEQLVDRILGIATKINPMRARVGNIALHEWKIFDEWINKFIETHIYIIDKPNISVTEVKAISKRIKRESGIDAIYIDYLQLMAGERTKNSNREQEISSISRGLKITAKSLNIPVIALSQLNREADSQRPTLRHLRESGAIEQDTDIVLFIHREHEEGRKALNGDFILAKHRNGAISDLPFLLDNEAMTSLLNPDDQNRKDDVEFKMQSANDVEPF